MKGNNIETIMLNGEFEFAQNSFLKMFKQVQAMILFEMQFTILQRH